MLTILPWSTSWGNAKVIRVQGRQSTHGPLQDDRHQRFAIVEPVFANIRHNKRPDRFTLRGTQKVDTQWKLFCQVHNIEKRAHYSYAQEVKAPGRARLSRDVA